MTLPNIHYQPDYNYTPRDSGKNSATTSPISQVNTAAFHQHSQTQNLAQSHHLLHRIQNVPSETFYQNFSNFTSILPAALPEASLVVPIAGPIISTGIAGLDVYRTFKDSSIRYKNLDPTERWKKTADKTGKRIEYQILSAFILPAFALASTYKLLNRTLKYQWIPKLCVRYPRWYKAGGALTALVALNAPISKVANSITDWTWNPLVRHRKPKQFDTLRNKLNSLAQTLEVWESHIKKTTSFSQYRSN